MGPTRHQKNIQLKKRDWSTLYQVPTWRFFLFSFFYCWCRRGPKGTTWKWNLIINGLISTFHVRERTATPYLLSSIASCEHVKLVYRLHDFYFIFLNFLFCPFYDLRFIFHVCLLQPQIFILISHLNLVLQATEGRKWRKNKWDYFFFFYFGTLFLSLCGMFSNVGSKWNERWRKK